MLKWRYYIEISLSAEICADNSDFACIEHEPNGIDDEILNNLIFKMFVFLILMFQSLILLIMLLVVLIEMKALLVELMLLMVELLILFVKLLVLMIV